MRLTDKDWNKVNRALLNEDEVLHKLWLLENMADNNVIVDAAQVEQIRKQAVDDFLAEATARGYGNLTEFVATLARLIKGNEVYFGDVIITALYSVKGGESEAAIKKNILHSLTLEQMRKKLREMENSPLYKPQVGERVYCIYDDTSILAEEVYAVTNNSFLLNPFDAMEDSIEWYYEDFNQEWFIDKTKAMTELLRRGYANEEEPGVTLKVVRLSDDYYELRDAEESDDD